MRLRVANTSGVAARGHKERVLVHPVGVFKLVEHLVDVGQVAVAAGANGIDNTRTHGNVPVSVATLSPL